MRDGWRIGTLAACLLMVTPVAGCAKPIGGQAVADPDATRTRSSSAPSSSSAPAGEEGSAQAVLGDLTTVDPCSLTDPSEFSSFGASKLAPPDSLDECLVEIKTSAKEPLSVYIGALDRGAAYPELRGKPTKEISGGLKVVDYDVETSFCNELLVFSDDITLSVNAYPFEGDEPKLCDIVKAGMDKVVDVVRSGKIKHREYPANSFGRLDPCAVAPTGVAAAVPGLGSVPPKTYPGKHNCLWANSDSVNGARLRLMFSASTPPVAQGTATASTIAGRQTVTSPGVNTGPNVYCFVEAAHIPFEAAGQSGLVEKAYVSVRLPKAQADQACKAATAVANAVWPKLPSP